MFTSREIHSGRGGGGIGVAPSDHVYGPANVHLLPCKIHHSGPAPVAAYFRPTGPAAVAEDIDTVKCNTGGDVLQTNGDIMTKVHARDWGDKQTEYATSNKEEDSEKGHIVKEGGHRRDDGLVWEYFEDDAEIQTARFRGRKFMGRKAVFPEGVHGVVLREKPWPEGAPNDDQELKTFWAAETSFRDIMVWGHDEIPQETTVDRCLAWMNIANSIHDP